ncbi:MAG TPA: M23 family metallopeptidase [Candidatus Eisenbacteria bacterium]|nr:M23 family metallopeptidase [Candidatus Eisenbacteria bacterium]
MIAACVSTGVERSGAATERAAAVPEQALLVPLDRPLAHPPLDLPLVLNGGFGEFRSNHFHAGLDLGTGGQVGRSVYAPLPGWIERVRASGAGYGRSLYLHADDGRLLVFGHLDAFAPPIAGYIAAVQESSGQYEQDLWPPAGRFRVTAGQRIAWTGESGAGGPHLHIEIRRGDIAYNPLRAGLAIPDTSAPTLASVTLEPLDDTSYVERSPAPVTVRLAESPPRVRVLGRVRVMVAARDGVWRGVDRMVPWSVSTTFEGSEVECRFDSVSWATDMVESDYVYDTGRVLGEKGFVMWAPAGFRPTIFHTSARASEPAGTITVRPGDPPRTLRVAARDAAGRSSERSVILEPPARGMGAPDTSEVGPQRAERDSTRWFAFAMLPDGFMRVVFRGAPVGSRRVTIGGRSAAFRGGEWVTVVQTPQSKLTVLLMGASGLDADGRPWSRSLTGLLRPGARMQFEDQPDIDAWLPDGALFEPARMIQRPLGGVGDAPRELVARSEVLELLPVTLPLRAALRVETRPHRPAGSAPGLFHDDGSGWDWMSAPIDSNSGRRTGETRHLGRFALFSDTLAPRVTPLAARRRAVPGAYQRWALEASVREQGSGVDARASFFVVDGRRVPSEWDPEKSMLRWRPQRVPAKGPHRYAVTVTDRAGNVRRTQGSFTMR